MFIKKYWWIALIIIFLLSKKKIDQVVNLDDVLKQGDKNYDVLTLQKWINKHLVSGFIKEDSLYGTSTAIALYVILDEFNQVNKNYITLVGAEVTSVNTKWLYSTIK